MLRRAVAIGGTYNFRDVGGYETDDGGMIRWGRLFRSDALHNLRPSATTALRTLGLRTVIDLRSDQERRARPDNLPEGGPEYFACPILDQHTIADSPARLEDVYDHIISARGTTVVEAVRILACPGAVPAVVHCAAGKDRTGVVIGLLLSSLGVHHEIVASDFAATSLFLTDEFASVLTADSQAGVDAPLLRAPAELMCQLLARVEADYGGALGYLLAHGITSAEHARLRAHLVAPAHRPAAATPDTDRM
jgi:protein-tyrosine phosphatase